MKYFQTTVCQYYKFYYAVATGDYGRIVIAITLYYWFALILYFLSNMMHSMLPYSGKIDVH